MKDERKTPGWMVGRVVFWGGFGDRGGLSASVDISLRP